MKKGLKGFGWGYIILGLLVAAIGVCFICFNNSLEVLAIVMGIILALFGIVFGVITLAKTERGVMFALRIILAVLCLVCGVVTAILREGAVSVISSIFCLLLIVDGSFKLQTAILSKRYSVFGWWLMLVLSCLVIVSAFLITKLATDGSATLTVLIGIVMCVDGLSNILSAIFTRANDSRMTDAILLTEEQGEEDEKAS